MQFIPEGPRIPENLIKDHEHGRVVFFCGAGISCPAGLPDFKGLVNSIYENLGERHSPLEESTYKEGKFDLTLDLLQRRLGSRLIVREKLIEILSFDQNNNKSTRIHDALLTLSTVKNQCKIVTTNFDRIFEAIIDRHSIKTYKAPLLPVPKNNKWNGLVYLHGLLPANRDSDDLDKLVITSGDFGLAYLVERWASRFVSDVFKSHTICFVGYSINDPIMRYMMDALAADKAMGESCQCFYAFASYAKNAKEIESIQWQSKNVIPILYDIDNENSDHNLLHDSLVEWANVFKKGISGKIDVINRYSRSMPTSVADDDQIGRVIWALSEESGTAAKIFADKNREPYPPVEWLDQLIQNRYSKTDLQNFGIYSTDISKDTAKHSMLDRPTPCSHSPLMNLVYSPKNRHVKLDAVMYHIGRWVSCHLEKEEVLSYVINSGCCLQQDFKRMVNENLTMIDRDKSLLKIWKIISSGLSCENHDDADTYSLEDEYNKLGWSASFKYKLLKCLEPVVSLRSNLDRKTFHRDRDLSGFNVSDFVRFEIVLSSGNDAKYFLHNLLKLLKNKIELSDMLPNLTLKIHRAIELMVELENASREQDFSCFYRPSIGYHDQNEFQRPWTLLIDYCVESWLVAKIHNPSIAKLEVSRWMSLGFPLFMRLSFFAAKHLDIYTVDESLSILLHGNGSWLWNKSTLHEVVLLLKELSPKLNEQQSGLLCSEIVHGPRFGGANSECIDKNNERNEWRSFYFLGKLKIFGCRLTSSAQEKYDFLKGKNSYDDIAGGDKDEFPMHIEVWSRESSLPEPFSFKSVVEFLKNDNEGTDIRDDTWGEICQKKPLKAMAALLLFAKHDKIIIRFWERFFWSTCQNNFQEICWKHLSRVVVLAPESFFIGCKQSLSFWMSCVGKYIQSSDDNLFVIVDRILDLSFEDSFSETDDIVQASINSPIGNITLALIRWWINQELHDKQLLPYSLKKSLGKICDLKFFCGRYGRCVIAAYTIHFFRIDPDWTKVHILPLFSWKSNVIEAKAMWQGFLWNGRLFASIINLLKDSFIETSGYYNFLNDFGKVYVSMLTISVMEKILNVSDEVIHDAIDTLPLSGIEDMASSLAAYFKRNIEAKKYYWENSISRFFNEFFPKSDNHKTASISHSFAEICSLSDECFPEVYDCLSHFFINISNTDRIIDNICDLKIHLTHGDYSVRFLSDIIDTGDNYPSRNLSKILKEIDESTVLDGNRYKLRELKDYLVRLGQYDC